MKKILILAAILVLVILGALYYQFRYKPLQSQQTNENGILTITDMPANFCPIRAELAIFQVGQTKLLGQNSVNITNCRYLDLNAYLKGMAGDVRIFIKIPKALAFHIDVSLPLKSSYQQPLALGDVDGNNVIDQEDERLVVSQLFKDKNIELTDLDSDGVVTMIDVSLVRINKGVGSEKSDGSSWENFDY